MLDSFSPLENLKAFGLAFAAGVVSTIFVNLYAKWMKENGTN
jgi:hypothetical protein